MERTNYYVITGGVGFGKTTLIEELRKNKLYFEIPEFAEELIKEQVVIGGKLTPWTDYYAFGEELLQRRIQAYLGAPADRICFFDRGIPDHIAFYLLDNKKISKDILNASREYRYNSQVFITPPWEEIYRQTDVRPHSFEYASRLGSLIVDTYEDLGYKVIEIPKVSLEKRVQFIVKQIIC